MTDATEAAASLAEIERTLELDAEPERVWRAISDPDEVERWFPDRAEWDLRAGGTGALSWSEHGSYPIRIDEVDPPRYLAWRWGREAGDDPETSEFATLVEWWVEPRAGGGTTLRMRESGFRVPEHRAGNDAGWTEELAKLVRYVQP